MSFRSPAGLLTLTSETSTSSDPSVIELSWNESSTLQFSELSVIELSWNESFTAQELSVIELSELSVIELSWNESLIDQLSEKSSLKESVYDSLPIDTSPIVMLVLMFVIEPSFPAATDPSP